jgi:hypothetical protein
LQQGDRSAGKQKEKHDEKILLKFLPVLGAATSFSRVQPVKAKPIVQVRPTVVTVANGGSTTSLVGFGLLGLTALRRKLSR